MSKKKAIRNMLQLVLGCVICGMAVNWIAVPNGFAVTGITGLAMTIEKFTGIHYAMVSYGFTAVIIGATVLIMGVREVTNILFLSCLYPAVLYVTSYIPIHLVFGDKLVAVAAYGVVLGIGSGLSYRLGFSYGGTDTIGKILKHTILKTVPLKFILICLDGAVLLVMLTAFSFDAVTYAFIGQLIYVNSMNYIIFNTGPKIYEIQIIGDDLSAIEKFILYDIHKTTTIHAVVGGYTGEPKKQMDVVCNSKEYFRLREFIKFNKIPCFIKVFPLMHVFGQHADFLDIESDMVE